VQWVAPVKLVTVKPFVEHAIEVKAQHVNVKNTVKFFATYPKSIIDPKQLKIKLTVR
jgi:hypothetical protein